MGYLETFASEAKDLVALVGQEKAYLVWVMGRYLGEADLDSLASTALTDGPDDKKLDFLYIDHDGKRLIFAQGYFSSKANDSAPANKASDLNTAAAWLLSGDLNIVPINIRETISEFRQALDVDEIDSIELFYVHNLPESLNVDRELKTVESHIRASLESGAVGVRAEELGAARIQHLHDSQESHIEVKDEIEFPERFGIEQSGPNWKAYVSSVPGSWLHALYTRYGEALFSANYRGFLGGGRRRRVNTGIRESAETRSEDFWAFNNGITILTVAVNDSSAKRPKLSGISIINGAQTTGSIGSVDVKKSPINNLKVLCRVIQSSDPTTVADIVRFNNTQNAIATWDQYSNDPEQKRLVDEFKELKFDYTIKRGHVSSGNELSIDEVIQPLLAFHGRPQDAVRGKNAIFERKPLYQNAFEGKKARHVLFVYTLSRAVDQVRIKLKNKSNAGELIDIENQQIEIMRNLRFKSFFIALMAVTIETALGKKCDTMLVGFTADAARGKTLDDLSALWVPVIETLLALVTASSEAKDFAARLSDDAFVPSLSGQMVALLHAMKAAEKHQEFAALVAGT